MIYIRRQHLDWARGQAEAYREYRAGLRRLRALAKEIIECYQRLGESQEVALPS
jgi:hypothetical protein